MSPRVTTITRKALIIKGKEAGIINPDQLFTRKLLNRVNKYDKKMRITQYLQTIY